MLISFVRKHITIIVAVAVAIVGILVVVFAQSRYNPMPQVLESMQASQQRPEFPRLDQSSLSQDQQKLISVLKNEYDANPDGVKYSDGIKEPWCADFVSWVFNEVGKPLVNPNSGSWRIPGTFTLREYYESVGKLRLANTGYTPKIGDIMLYDNPSPFGQHTNIVIKNTNGIVTTIGGNEPGGIRVVVHEKPDVAGFIGYGEF